MNQANTGTGEGRPLPPARIETILVVEDVAANIDILVDAFGDEYSVSVTLDGQSALKTLDAVNPDLILLDVMMPGMDGYEVCARLKENPATRDIPVIFLTAMNEDVDEAKGLRLGAVDYITKPFNPSLVKARIRNHLDLRRARMEVVEQRNTIAADYQKLRELEKLRDDLVHMIVHDMRSPLTGLVLFLEALSPENFMDPDFQNNLAQIREASRALSDMVTSLLDVSRLEAGQMPLHCEVSDLGQLTRNATQRLSGLTQGRQVTVHTTTASILAYCDRSLTERIVQNLLGNALKFTPPEGSIRIELGLEDQWARFSITDTGPGIPVEYHEKVFQKFGQVEQQNKRKAPSSGLGLTFCKLATEAQGGDIQLASEAGRGATFHLRLPRPRGASGVHAV